MRLWEDWICKKQITTIHIKGIHECRTHREQAEEAIEVLKIGTTDIGRTLQFLGSKFINRRLTSFQHLTHILWNLIDHLLEGEDKRIFIAITERAFLHHHIQETVQACLIHHLYHIRMIRIERHKPVAQLIEEGEALHLGEASEIDIRTLFLHIHHPLETGFHLF